MKRKTEKKEEEKCKETVWIGKWPKTEKKSPNFGLCA